MMNNQTKVDLMIITTEKDEINQIVEKTRTTASVYAEVLSISQSEFFEAGRLGFQPELKVVMYDFEYNDEKIVRVNGKLYSVYRTYYVIGSDRVELYLEERGGTKDEQPEPSPDDPTP